MTREGTTNMEPGPGPGGGLGVGLGVGLGGGLGRARRDGLVDRGLARSLALWTWFGVGLLGLGGVVLAWSTLRPIGGGVDAEGASVADVVTPSLVGSRVEADVVSSLVVDNPFGLGRRPFVSGRVAVSDNGAEEGGDEVAGDGADGAGGAMGDGGSSRVVVDAGDGLVVLDDVESVSDDVRSAFYRLSLEAVFERPARDGDGTRGVAMIRLVGGASAGGDDAAMLLSRGDTFTDPSHDAADWSVRRVDVASGRVLVSRSGSTLALELFDGVVPRGVGGGVGREVGSGDGEGVDGVLRVERQTVAEVEAELRAAGIGDEEIALLLADLAAVRAGGADAPRASPATEAVVERVVGEAASRSDGGASGEEGGLRMAELLRMMGTGKNPIEMEMERERERARAAREGGGGGDGSGGGDGDGGG